MSKKMSLIEKIKASANLSELKGYLKTGMTAEESAAYCEKRAQFLAEFAEAEKVAGIVIPRTTGAKKEPRELRTIPVGAIGAPDFAGLADRLASGYSAIGGEGIPAYSYLLAGAAFSDRPEIHSAAAHIYAAKGAGRAHDARSNAVNGGHRSTMLPVLAAIGDQSFVAQILERVKWIVDASARLRFPNDTTAKFSDGVERAIDPQAFSYFTKEKAE